VRIPGDPARSLGDVVVAGQAQRADGEGAHGRQGVRAACGANRRAVLAEGDVPDPRATDIAGQLGKTLRLLDRIVDHHLGPGIGGLGVVEELAESGQGAGAERGLRQTSSRSSARRKSPASRKASRSRARPSSAERA